MPRLPAPILLAAVLAALSAMAPTSGIGAGALPTAFTLSSPALADGGDIPVRYTCDGVDISPPLVWSAPPLGAKSLALIVDDPDAPDPREPKMTWTHWVLYNLPPVAASLPEDAARSALPGGAHQGLNDWERPGYDGPCPPIGRHRYFLKLYALDVILPNLAPQGGAQLEAAIAGHVLAQAELVGRYEKKAR